MSMCSATTLQLNDVIDLTLEMARTASSALPISCTCLITSHEWNIMTISRQVIPARSNRFKREVCRPKSSVRRVFMNECVYENCIETAYSGTKTEIQSESKVDRRANWLTASFTWDACGLESGSTNLGLISITGNTMMALCVCLMYAQQRYAQLYVSAKQK